MKNAGSYPAQAIAPHPESWIPQSVKEALCAVPLSPEELQASSQAFPRKMFKKGAFLLKEGQIAMNCFYIFKGCVREYYLKDGEERTTEFYMEGDSLSSAVSRIQGTPAKKYWECIEDTTVSICTDESEKELYRRFPRLETLCRLGVEEKLGAYQEAMATYMTSTPEERYLNLLKSRPDLLDRVPQYQLASYIGVKPESLSRIRGRILGKQQSKEARIQPPQLTSSAYTPLSATR